MLGGIVFQLATISVFVIFETEFFIRYTLDKPIRSRDETEKKSMSPRLKIMTFALAFSTLCLFIR